MSDRYENHLQWLVTLSQCDDVIISSYAKKDIIDFLATRRHSLSVQFLVDFLNKHKVPHDMSHSAKYHIERLIVEMNKRMRDILI